jgi:hypothetical protein
MSSENEEERTYEEGAAGTDKSKKKSDPLKEYEANEPMTPAKIQEHEPTAVRRDPSDQKIVERGQEGAGTDPEKAREIARSKGMAKGEAGAWETGDQYEQGSAGTSGSSS